MGITRRNFIKNSAALAATAAVGIPFVKPQEAKASPIRPPGALSEKDFLAACIRCGRCTDACPNRCITSFTSNHAKKFSISPGKGQEGTPVLFPREQACNLCQGNQGDELLCTAACPTGALQVVKKSPEVVQDKVSMGTAVVDTNLCYSYNGGSCGVCVKACPFEGKALKAGHFERPIVDPNFCVGCGLCERSCIRYPQAISIVSNKARNA